jgi:hypothetical protein
MLRLSFIQYSTLKTQTDTYEQLQRLSSHGNFKLQYRIVFSYFKQPNQKHSNPKSL